MNFCYITPKRGGIYIDCSFDPDFIEAIKAHVPAAERKYDSVTKQWWVSDKYRRQAELDCKSFFEKIIEC